MSKSKIVVMMALIVFAMGIFLVGDVVAGKEAIESCTMGIYGTSKVIAFGEDYIYGAGEAFGTWIGDTGKEMCHGATAHPVFEWQIEKGFYSENGGVVWTLLNGDKIYLKFFDSGKAGEIPKGTLTVLGGTGKCAGIEGSAEYTMHQSVSSVEGAVWQGYCKMKFHYKLP
jgi:hypothetical protein